MGKLKILMQNYLLKKNYVILNYNLAEKNKYFDLIREVRKKSSLKACESYQIITSVRDICLKRKGNLAEIGIWKGGSAKLICEMKGENPLYLFDTFTGLPEPTNEDNKSNFKKGIFKEVTIEEVKNYLKDYKNVYIFKSEFPNDLPDNFINKKFIFVNLDVDLYKGTLNCLKFFYPRLESGGILISHDYSIHPGVKKAFDEFFKDKLEPVIELPQSQCIIVKI